jgi:hypothetical protein
MKVYGRAENTATRVFNLALDWSVFIFSKRCTHGKQVPTRPYSEPDNSSPHPHDNATEYSDS